MPVRHYNSLVEPNPDDADDERSLSDADDLHFSRLRSPRRRTLAPLFPGQDVRPTSRKELMGWYSYAWAAEVFVVCGIGSFIPVTLEQLARENGVLLSDESIPCTGTSQGLVVSTGPSGEQGGQCVVYILGTRINTASFAMYTFSISVLLQSLIIVSMSGAADHGAYRKRLLLAFAMMGSIATMLFITISPDIYILSALWAIFGNIGFGASFVLLNAFLPVLVRHHPTLLYGEEPSQSSTPNSTEAHSLLTNTENVHAFPRNGEAPKGKNNSDLVLSTQISSYGIAIGYTAAVLLQIFSIMVVLYAHSTVQSLKVVLFFIGLWWFVFTIPAALWLRPRPGPPLPMEIKPSADGLTNIDCNRSWWGYIRYSWVGLGKTILRARRLQDVMLFLAAWFLVSDGVATVSGTAVLFAKTNLHMKPPQLAMISVVSTVTGVIGAFGWPRISKAFNRTPSQTILICMCVFLIIPIYGLMGFIPAVQRAGVGGLTSPWEMYLLGAVYGFVLGGVSGYCRSVFGELIPPGSEAAFYALYAVTDKGSSIFGPAIVGLLTDKYGDIRVSFWFLTVLLLAPLPLIYNVDVARGRREARALAEEELKSVVSAGGARGGENFSADVERL